MQDAQLTWRNIGATRPEMGVLLLLGWGCVLLLLLFAANILYNWLWYAGEEDFALEGSWHIFLHLLSPSVRKYFSLLVSWPMAWCMRLGSSLSIGNEWVTIIDDRLALGGLPFRPGDPLWLYETYHVRAVVNTCDEYRGQEKAYQSLGISQLYIPMVDATGPTHDQLTRAVDFIDSFVKNVPPPSRVFIHCRAGKGRSATILLAYLMAKRGMSRVQAQTYVEAKRRISTNVFNRPILLDFERHLQSLP